MKVKCLTILLCVMFLTGCESSQQVGGLFMGSTLGGIFGSSIGGLMEGPRGSDAGQALGMIIGGAVGAAVTAPKKSDSEQVSGRSDTYEEETDRYNRHSTTRKSEQGGLIEQSDENFNDVAIENLRFVDENNNHVLDASERGQIIFEIHNTSNATLYRVTPVVNVSDSKNILISPTALIDALPPGKSVRYTAEVYGKKKLHRGVADFSIGFVKGNYLHTVRKFQLNTSDSRA